MAHLWVNTSRTSERKNLRRPVVAGSAASNAIVIDDPAASHHTFKIAFDNAGWFVEDLADRLTVKVNGVPVFRRYLEDGDEICVGDTALVFHDDAEPEEALFAFDDGVFPVELEELSQLGPFYERRLIQLAYGTRKLKRTVISICVLSVLFSAAVLWFAFHQARLAEVGGAKDSKGGQVDVLSQVADSHTRKASGVSLEEALARYPLARDIPRRLFESTLGALVAEAEESHAEYEEACKAAEILAGSREYYGAYSRMMKFVNRFPSSSRALSAVQLATRYRSMHKRHLSSFYKRAKLPRDAFFVFSDPAAALSMQVQSGKWEHRDGAMVATEIADEPAQLALPGSYCGNSLTMSAVLKRGSGVVSIGLVSDSEYMLVSLGERTIAVNWSISGVTDSVAIEAPDRGTDYVEFGLADEHLVVIARFRGMEAKVPGSHLLVGRPVVRTTEKGVTVHMVSAGW